MDAISLRVSELMHAQNQATVVGMEESDEESDEEEEEWVRPEAHIAGWGIATPFPVSTEHFLAIDRRERVLKGQTEKQIEAMATFVRSSRIKNRHTCHPFYLVGVICPLTCIKIIDTIILTNYTNDAYTSDTASGQDCL
jgi:hypothetical protein